MSVKVSAEKNFRRAKVKPGKKRTGSPWISWRIAIMGGVAMLVLYTGYRATNLVLSASALQVHQIKVHGTERLSKGEVQALLGSVRGANILALDLDGTRERLLESPWVGSVAIRRVLPSTIEVFVSERKPIGLTRVGDRIHLVDRMGFLIDEYGPQYADYDLPLIDGAIRPPRDGEPLVDPAATELAGRFLDAIAAETSLASRISQIDVSNPRNVVVLLDGDTTFLHLGTEKFIERIQSYEDLSATLRASVPEIDYVDLRFDSRIYVQPVRGRRTSETKPVTAGN